MKTDKNSRTTTPEGTQPKPELTVPDSKTASKTAHITYEKWWDEYRPIKNHIAPNAPFDGCMFETYGAELEFVCASNSKHVWTLVDCDGKLWICEGLHYVNRMGYFVTEVPAPANKIFNIKI